MPAVALPQSVWKMLFTDFYHNTQSSCEKHETEIAEYTAPVIRKRVETHPWPVVDKDPAVTGGCEGGTQRMAQTAALPSGHQGLLIWWKCEPEGLRPGLLVSLHGTGVGLDRVFSVSCTPPCRRCTLAITSVQQVLFTDGYIALHDSSFLQLRMIWSHHQGSPHQPIRSVF